MSESVNITGVDVNEIVLKKAREICPSDTTSIEWKQCNVEALSFSDEKFDVVLCQQGLQYFPDRPKAFTEVNRVLSSKGRALFSVWRLLEYFPFYLALYKALERYVSSDAASILNSAFTLGNAAHLRELFKSIGFKNIEIFLVVNQMRCSPFVDFLIGGLAASPFGNDILKLKKTKREKMFQSIQESLMDYMDDHGLAAPMECNVVSVTK